MKRFHQFWRIASFLVLGAINAFTQQLGDTGFNPPIDNPAYPEESGPLVLIDEAHNNFHTVSGRYRAFADILRRDGFVVEGSSRPFSATQLAKAKILVIANALAEENNGNWRLPRPSAFTSQEIDALEKWVREGGSLLLIADHMPFPGAAEALAARFGATFTNGFAFREDRSARIRFDLESGLLYDHAITQGRDKKERTPFVVSFTGQAFWIRPEVEHQPLMTLPAEIQNLLPVQAWQFSDETPSFSAAGMLQGATLKFGEGRVAVFGEAAMFTAQVSGEQKRPMGINHPEAPHNVQFLLNTLHWLAGLLPKN